MRAFRRPPTISAPTACMTARGSCVRHRSHRRSGARERPCDADDIVVNLQGDEPLMPPAVVSDVAAALSSTPLIDIATAVAPIQTLEEFLDPSCVKALRGRDGQALYFSRAPVPWPRDDVARRAAGGLRGRLAAHRHLCLSGAKSAAICGLAADAARDDRETRAIARVGIRHEHLLADLTQAPPAGVDTPEDLERVRSSVSRTAGQPHPAGIKSQR